jgi:hypothetical protein
MNCVRILGVGTLAAGIIQTERTPEYTCTHCDHLWIRINETDTKKLLRLPDVWTKAFKMMVIAWTEERFKSGNIKRNINTRTDRQSGRVVG